MGAPTTRARVQQVLSGTGFRRFFGARIVSQLGDGIFQLAAASVLLFERPGDNPALTLLGITAFTLIPFSIIGPFAGVFVDRWQRRKILTRVPIARAVVAALLPVAALAGTSSAAFYACVLFVLSANRLFLVTMSAILPQLVPTDDLLVANSVATTGGAVANVVGQGVGSAVAAVVGGERTAILAAAAFGLSAVVARTVPVRPSPPLVRRPLAAELREVFTDMREGARKVRRSPRVVHGLGAIAVMQVLVGAMVAVLTYFFIHELRLGVGSATGILAVLALGIGTGVVLVPVAARRIRYDRLIPTAFAVAAVGCIGAAFTLSLATMIVGAGIIGISYAFAKIPVDTIVQEEMHDLVRGRAFALYDMLFNTSRVAGVAAVAVVYESGGTSRPAVAGIGVLYVTAAVWFAVLERGRAACSSDAENQTPTED